MFTQVITDMKIMRGGKKIVGRKYLYIFHHSLKCDGI